MVFDCIAYTREQSGELFGNPPKTNHLFIKTNNLVNRQAQTEQQRERIVEAIAAMW